MSLKIESIHAVVTGRVQGVGFRYAVRQKAASLELNGWVRNLVTGAVELEAEGEPESVEALLQWLHQGPPSAKVEKVEVRSREAQTKARFEDFQVRRDG
jgi:acylphosphatase